jgi:hypothetical protein
VRLALVAAAAAGLALVQLVGLLGWLGIPLGPASLIAFSLVWGIGIHDGMHLVQAWQRQTGRFRLTDEAALATLLAAAAAMAGFASLIFVRQPGLASLGQALTLGALVSLSSSLIVLPALLAWLSRHREESDAWSDDTAAENEPEFESAIIEPEPAVLPMPPESETAPAPAPAAAAPPDDEDGAAQILAFERSTPSSAENDRDSTDSIHPAIPRRRSLPRRAGESQPLPPEPPPAPTPLDHLGTERTSYSGPEQRRA